MFTVRPYKEEDAAACGDCFYEGFFSCSVDQNDKIHFSKALAAQYETKKHYGRWCKMFLKFYLKRYKSCRGRRKV